MDSVIATREEVEFFLSIQQPIVGSGFVSGEGYGFGVGSVSGYGSGYGDGYGYGSGYGPGSVSGYGCGYGYGSSNVCGNGYGGKDIKALNGNIVDYIDFIPTIITQVRDNIACGYIVKDDLTLFPCYVARVGDSFAHGETIKKAVADAEAKEMVYMPVEERIKKFVETFGSLDSKHTGKEFYEWHHILTGSCRFGRDEFCKAHDVDLTKKYTVRYFLDITDESYGSDVIKLIREAYNNMEG